MVPFSRQRGKLNHERTPPANFLTTPTDSICGQTDEEIAKLDEVERPAVREGKLRHCILRLTDLRGKGRERVCQTHHSGLAGSCMIDRAPSVDV